MSSLDIQIAYKATTPLEFLSPFNLNYCLILVFGMKAYQLWLISSITETRVCGLISSKNKFVIAD